MEGKDIVELTEGISDDERGSTVNKLERSPAENEQHASTSVGQRERRAGKGSAGLWATSAISKDHDPFLTHAAVMFSTLSDISKSFQNDGPPDMHAYSVRRFCR